MKQRTRIFVGCEGASERSYVRWLQAAANQLGLAVHFDGVIAGGGDPLAVVQESLKALRVKERMQGKFKFKAILLDSDKLGLTPGRDAQIAGLVRSVNAFLLYQEFDHEAILLRHLHKCGNLRPPGGGDSTVQLRKHWPSYIKPADALSLSKNITIRGFVQMRGSEPSINEFFKQFWP